MQETWVQSLLWEDSLEKEMATHSNILAWRIPWTEEPGRLQCMGSQRGGHNLATEYPRMHALSNVWRPTQCPALSRCLINTLTNLWMNKAYSSQDVSLAIPPLPGIGKIALLWPSTVQTGCTAQTQSQVT